MTTPRNALGMTPEQQQRHQMAAQATAALAKYNALLASRNSAQDSNTDKDDQ